MNDAPPVKQTVREGFYEIVDGLCRVFSGLSPFEVMNSDLQDVYDLYVDAAIAAHKKSKNNNSNNAVWVNSKTATWH